MAITKNSQIDLNGNEMILDADGDTTITADTDDQIDFKVAGTDTVVISGGAMALKGATPTLTIGDGDEEDAKIIFDGNTVDYHIGLDDSQDDLIIGRDTTLGSHPAIQINADKRVGMGGAPVTQLHVMGGNGVIFDNPNNGYSGLKITDDTSGDYNINFLAGRSQGNTKFKFFRYGRDQNTTPWSDYSSPVEIAHISGGSAYFAGDLLVGTTTEYTGTSGNLTVPLQLDIGANDTNSKYVFVNRSQSTGVIGGFRAGVTGFSQMGRVELQADNVGGGAQTSSFHVYTTLNATEARKMQIDGNGHVYFTSLNTGNAANDVHYNASSGNLYYITSSKRYKKNIKDMPDGVLDKIKQARPVTFDEKESGDSSYGLIAEELEELIPELVVKREIDGEELPDSITYSMMSVYLLKAMQEQQTIIEDLKARIETLEGG